MTTLLAIEDLSVHIDTPEGNAQVLDRVTLDVKRGDIVGLVGESGCGKSTVVKAILGTMAPNARIVHGRIRFDGMDLQLLDDTTLERTIRGRRIGFVPQDPALALNPLFDIATQLLEIWSRHAPEDEDRGKSAGLRRIVELFNRVQLPDAKAALQRYPHQFSGGQRQRILIAAAMLCAPELIVADEPTTALDVTTQQQILALLADLAVDSQLSVLLVTHDFGIVSQLCTRVSVMYAGQTVESGPKPAVLGQPQHPYTSALINCHPDRMATLEGIPGAVPSPLSPPPGCRFHPRCSVAQSGCAAREMRLRPLSGEVAANCIRFDPQVLESA